MNAPTRVAVVTGAASGIGRACAWALARNGASVIATDITQRASDGRDALDGGAEGAVDISFRRMDVTDESSVRETAAGILAERGRVDVLVNSAGGAMPLPFLETDEAQWRRIIELNLFGTMRCTRAFVPSMAEQRWGRIVNISSGAGQYGQVGQAAYSAAKGGVIGFTKTIALEFAASGVTANCVSPGPVVTPAWEEFRVHDPEAAKRYADRLAAAVPIGRLGRPEDIAEGVAFLASDAAAWVTGQTWRIDGGSVMT